MKLEIGTRVGALVSADKEKVLFLGWGTYNGEQVPPAPYGVEAAVFGVSTWEERDRMMQELVADARRDEKVAGTPDDELPPADFIQPRQPNPMITLDSGDVVWGYQCWWGPEDEIANVLKGRRVVEVPFAEFIASARR